MSVCGTGTSHLARGFSWQCGIRNFAITFRSPSQLSLMGNGFCLFPSLTAWTRISNTALTPILLRPPIAQMVRRCAVNINLLSIAYAFRPRLRSRLTLSGRAFLQETLGIRWRILTSFATHTGILTSKRSTSPSGLASQPLERSPTTVRRTVRSSVIRLAPVHYRRRVTRPVSYYALFKWWLLLSQHPGCLSNSTSFST